MKVSALTLAVLAMGMTPAPLSAQVRAAAPAQPPAVAQDACSKAAAYQVCDTPALVKLRAEMERKFSLLIATGLHRATWQADAAATDLALRNARDDAGQPLNVADLIQMFADKISELDHAIALTQRIPQVVETARIQSPSCLITGFTTCRTTASGTLWHASDPDSDTPSRSAKPVDKSVVHWQMIHGASASGGIQQGVLLWMASGRGTAQLIGYRVADATFQPPRITSNGLLWLPGYFAGTGAYNADLLMEWDVTTRQWYDVDLQNWRTHLSGKLPNGLAVWKGVSYDFETLTATTPLWLERDANCCPTGGKALIVFEIRDRSLMLTDTKVDVFAKAASPKD